MATKVSDLLIEHDKLIGEYRQAWEDVRQAVTARTNEGTPVSEEVGNCYDEAVRKVQRSFGRLTQVAPVGTELVGVDGALTVAENNSHQVILTADGGPYHGRWHEGESKESTRVERWEHGQRVFHGYIDVTTRMITQTG